MTATVIITRDSDLRQRIRSLATDESAVVLIDDCTGLESALATRMGTVVIDLNLSWEHDITECVRRCREEGGATEVIAFLHEQAGELAIRAHLAGADRVISQSQFEDELAELI